MRRHLLRIFRFTLWITLSFSMKKRTFPILYISQRADVLFGFKTSKIYVSFFNSNRCCPVLPFCIFLCSLLMLWEIARITLWAVTFSVPRYRYLRNSISCFTSEKEPYAWMLLVHAQTLSPIFTRDTLEILCSFLFHCL